MTYRVINDRTGVNFVAADVRRALRLVLAEHVHDDYVTVAIDVLAAAVVRGDKAVVAVWADALGVTVTSA